MAKAKITISTANSTMFFCLMCFCLAWRFLSQYWKSRVACVGGAVGVSAGESIVVEETYATYTLKKEISVSTFAKYFSRKLAYYFLQLEHVMGLKYHFVSTCTTNGRKYIFQYWQLYICYFPSSVS